MRQPELHTAREVSEYLLDMTANALMQRDFDSLARAFKLPQFMTTSQTRITLNTPDELQAVFEHMCDYYQSLGVTELNRICEAAEFDDLDTVRATHTSHILVDGEPLVPPYPVYSVLERTDGVWQIASSDYALDDDNPQAQAIHGVSRKDPAAMAIYQDHVDTLADAMIRDDFPQFLNRISLPLTITTETDVVEIATAEHLKSVFERVAGSYKQQGVTHLIRTVREASFYGKDEIRGIHESDWIHDGKRIVTPYPNRLRLIRDTDGAWRETHAAHAIQNNSDNFHLWTRVSPEPRLPDLNIDS